MLWNVFGEFSFRLFKEFFNAITLWKIEPTRSSFIKPDVRWDPFIAELFRIIVVALLALMYGGITNHKKGLQRNVSSAKGMKLLRKIFKRIFCGNYCLCTPWLAGQSAYSYLPGWMLPPLWDGGVKVYKSAAIQGNLLTQTVPVVVSRFLCCWSCSSSLWTTTESWIFLLNNCLERFLNFLSSHILWCFTRNCSISENTSPQSQVITG